VKNYCVKRSEAEKENVVRVRRFSSLKEKNVDGMLN